MDREWVTNKNSKSDSPTFAMNLKAHAQAHYALQQKYVPVNKSSSSVFPLPRLCPAT